MPLQRRHGCRPDDLLPGERELALQLDISRPILRGALKPGSYVLSLTPTDAAGNRGTAATTTFKVVRG